MSALQKILSSPAAPAARQPAWKARLAQAAGAPVAPLRPRRTLYLLMDCSGSMSDYGKLENAKAGAVTFARDATAKGYATGIIAFSCEAVCLADPHDREVDVAKVLFGVPASGSTDLTGALRLATEKLRNRSGQRAVCVVTDGMPDDRTSAVRTASALQSFGVEILALGTDDADKEFLDQIVSSKELSVTVPRQQLRDGVAKMALLLPG